MSYPNIYSDDPLFFWLGNSEIFKMHTTKVRYWFSGRDGISWKNNIHLMCHFIIGET
jgi:hypothetical protein